LQGELAQAIAGEIMVKLTSQEQARLTDTNSVDPDAYEAYLKGRFFWNKRSGEGFRKGMEYFNQAIARDPSYAPPYAGLADSYALLGSIGLGYNTLPPREAMPKAKAAALKALEIDSTLAEAHTSLGLILSAYEWNWADSLTEFQRAIELNPGYATAHQWYAWLLTALGRWDEATAENRRAYEFDPLSVVINTQICSTFNLSRQYDKAIEQCRKTLELDPDFVQLHYNLGRAYEEQGKYPEAIAEFQRGKDLSGGSPAMVMALAHAYAASGRKAEALRAIDELKNLASKTYVPALFFAPIYARLGEKEQAFQYLEKAFAERTDYLIFLGREPLSDPVRSDPRFDALLRRLGLPH
jgi:tetratricopeptide (TPR) repeat protein